MRSPDRNQKSNPLLLIVVLFAVIVACDTNANRTAPSSAIPIIQNKEQLEQIVAAAGDRLVIFEFFAVWCPPCKELAPILDEIARENSGVLDLYKIDTDKSRDLARDFRVTGIPHVVFFKNQERVLSLSGLYPKQMYVNVINRLAPLAAAKKSNRTDGT